MSKFSHIYIEERVAAYPVAQHVLSRFPGSIRIMIRHYKDVFNRPHQDFRRQKASPKLILAVKQEPFLYPGPEVCEDFGNQNFYYTSPVLNCIYDCHYCYLQGLYPSANLVIFVNIEEFFEAADRQLESGPLYLCPSYDTDLLALEGVVPYASRWIEFAGSRKELRIELRTKSANYGAIAHLKPVEQVILAWSLSPDKVAQRCERLAPTLKARLTAIRAALDDGWQVRLCFEPLLKVYDWQRIYGEFLDEVFSMIRAEKVFDANIGVFRMGKEQFKRISRMRTDTDVFAFPMVCREGGVVTYEDEKVMRDFFYQHLSRYLPREKIYG